jgi:hypothetical protein
MTTYQYYLAVVPKEGFEKTHGSIPDKTRVSMETGYFESEAAIYWEKTRIKADDIVAEIDSIFERANWRNGITSINAHLL